MVPNRKIFSPVAGELCDGLKVHRQTQRWGAAHSADSVSLLPLTRDADPIRRVPTIQTPHPSLLAGVTTQLRQAMPSLAAGSSPLATHRLPSWAARASLCSSHQSASECRLRLPAFRAALRVPGCAANTLCCGMLRLCWPCLPFAPFSLLIPGRHLSLRISRACIRVEQGLLC